MRTSHLIALAGTAMVLVIAWGCFALLGPTGGCHARRTDRPEPDICASGCR